jgi:hypothetical protein
MSGLNPKAAHGGDGLLFPVMPHPVLPAYCGDYWIIRLRG